MEISDIIILGIVTILFSAIMFLLSMYMQNNVSYTEKSVKIVDTDNYYNDKITRLLQEFSALSEKFYAYQTNPEILITKPLLLDVNIPSTKKMINDFMSLHDYVSTNFSPKNNIVNTCSLKTIKYHVNKLEILVNNACKSFIDAENYDSVIMHELSDNDKNTALEYFNVVLDEKVTKKDRDYYWLEVIRIIEKSGVDSKYIDNFSTKNTDGLLKWMTFIPFDDIVNKYRNKNI